MMRRLRALPAALRGVSRNLGKRVLAIALAQGCAVVGTLLFVLFLPDAQLGIVVGLMAMAGFISATAVSNNTAKIYSNIRANPSGR